MIKAKAKKKIEYRNLSITLPKEYAEYIERKATKNNRTFSNQIAALISLYYEKDKITDKPRNN